MSSEENEELEVESGPIEYTDERMYQLISDIQIESPLIPPLGEIAGYGLPDHEQKFQRVEIPYFKSFKEEKAFNDQLWKWREEGYWFFNNGEPTWITGTHWYFLNFWELDVGLPDYRDIDRRIFWFINYCDNDPNCYGVVEITCRRMGKSFRAACWLLERISRMRNAHGGIASKTGNDAEGFFKEKLIQPWRMLPKVFSPMTDGTSNPVTQLRFFAPATKGKNKSSNTEELKSWIDFATAGEHGYDGPKLQALIHDEDGKAEKSDVWERWKVAKKCLIDRTKIIGKCIATTTVEELENGGGAFLEKWKKSNFNKKKSNGQTLSGLYRLFSPAWEGQIIDEYGFTDKEASMKYIIEEREGEEGADLLTTKRHFPCTVREAFSAAINGCHFNQEKLIRREDELMQLPKQLYMRYDLEYKNGIRFGDVMAVPKKDGKWYISRMPGEFENRVNRNSEGRPISPKNRNIFRGGVDTFDTDKVVDLRKASKAAFAIKRRYDAAIDAGKAVRDFQTNRYVCFYWARPSLVTQYEDYIKSCIFWGMSMNVETNKPGLHNKMIEWGFENFLSKRSESVNANPRSETDAYGNASSTTSIESYTALINSYYEEDVYGYGEDNGYWQIMDFPMVIQDNLSFDKTKTTKSDLTVAMGQCELDDNDKVKHTAKVDTSHLPKMFREYRVVGNKSVPVKR
jgi:hypothetical protein